MTNQVNNIENLIQDELDTVGVYKHIILVNNDHYGIEIHRNHTLQPYDTMYLFPVFKQSWLVGVSFTVEGFIQPFNLDDYWCMKAALHFKLVEQYIKESLNIQSFKWIQ